MVPGGIPSLLGGVLFHLEIPCFARDEALASFMSMTKTSGVSRGMCAALPWFLLEYVWEEDAKPAGRVASLYRELPLHKSATSQGR